MPASRYITIANTLEKRVLEDPYDPLPSIAKLAKEYGAAYQTIWKAVHFLSKKGVLKVRMGARTMPSSAEKAPPKYEELRENIRTNIQEGIWKSGESLPKFEWFKKVFNVGYTTIAEAFTNLAEQGLVHKRGKHWIVGSLPMKKVPDLPSNFRNHSRRVALFMFPRLEDANNFFGPSPFSGNISEELVKQNIKIETVFHENIVTPNSDDFAGFYAIETRMNSLGDNYCGLFVHNAGSSVERFQQGLSILLSKKKKPIILYDPQNALPTFTRTIFNNSALFFRLYPDDATAAKLCVMALLEHGHKKVGFPNMFTPRDSWVTQRIAYVKNAASCYAPELIIHTSDQSEPFWTYVQDKQVTILNYLFRGITQTLNLAMQPPMGVLASPSIRRQLYAATPSMSTLLQQGITAIIAGNDYIARDYHYWFKMMGIQVPGDISLISFDNQSEFMTYPMSTIDFGFARLGYKAAHILIGDISIKADSKGQLPGTCTLIDRESIGRPREGNRLFSSRSFTPTK